MNTDCKHLNFGVIAEVHRLIKSETDDTVIAFRAQFTVHCAQCDKQFEFTSPREALRSLERITLSINILPATGKETEFRTRVHVADKPDSGIQRCFRCDTVLAESHGAWMVPEGHESPSAPWWTVGGYIGIIERADGDSVNPRAYTLMDHDAQGEDEIICTFPS
jgi:hypothetical protein